jgi:hypothetical protein
MAFGTLTILHADGRREPLTVARPTVRIGRDRSNDIVLSDTDVSGFHAEILADSSGMQILDLGSANGTEVDGRRILDVPQPLADGSVIRIGGSRIVVATGGQSQVGPARVAPSDPGSALLSSLLNQAPAGAPRKATEPLPTIAPPPANLALILRPAAMALEPGKSEQLAVELHNRGRLPERVLLAVEGVEWAALEPEELTIAPGEQLIATLHLSPPRAPENRAGVYGFQVTARPERLPDTRFTVVGQLTVGAYTEFRFDLLDPRARTGWTRGSYTAQIRNNGNLALPFTLTGHDEAGAFSFRFRPEPLVVEPGEQRRSQVSARLGLRRLFGQPQTYAFMITAAPGDDSAPAQQASARLVQRPPLPPWLLTLLATLLVLSLIIGLFALTLPPAIAGIRSIWPTRGPTSTPTPTITPTLQAATLVPTETPLPTIESLYTPEAQAPQVIVPTVVVNVQPAPPQPAPQPIIVPPVTVPVPVTPAPLPPDRVVEFNKLGGNDVSGRTPIRGDEYFGQDMTLCVYREIPLPAPPGPGPRPNDPPQTVDGLTLSVSDGPDPVLAGASLNLTIGIENGVAERRFYGLALTVRPPAGTAVDPPADTRCVVQPDGSVSCALVDLGGDSVESVSLNMKLAQPGLATTTVELSALVGDTADAPARTLAVTARAQTEVLPAPVPVADCGLPNVEIMQQSLALRSPQSFLLQVPPVLYPPPAGGLQVPLHSLTSDTGPDQFASDAIVAIAFQRVVAEVAVTVYFPGPAGNFLTLYGVDEQGKLIATFRTDRLSVPGLYQLRLAGVERPVRMVLLQNAPSEGPGPVAVSGGGIFLTRVEVNYTSRN